MSITELYGDDIFVGPSMKDLICEMMPPTPEQIEYIDNHPARGTLMTGSQYMALPSYEQFAANPDPLAMACFRQVGSSSGGAFYVVAHERNYGMGWVYGFMYSYYPEVREFATCSLAELQNMRRDGRPCWLRDRDFTPTPLAEVMEDEMKYACRPADC